MDDMHRQESDIMQDSSSIYNWRLDNWTPTDIYQPACSLKCSIPSDSSGGQFNAPSEVTLRSDIWRSKLPGESVSTSVEARVGRETGEAVYFVCLAQFDDAVSRCARGDLCHGCCNNASGVHCPLE